MILKTRLAAQAMAERPSKKPSETGNNKTMSGELTVTDIKELFILMKENGIAELDLEQKHTKIHILSTHAPVVQQTPMMVSGVAPMGMVGMPAAAHPPVAPLAPAAPPAVATPGESPAATPPASDTPANIKTITSPMVGTFYRSPSPEAPPFISVGDSVKEDITL
jgi:acetyl-CoA carboxylase biotin carboxyl carrier protein